MSNMNDDSIDLNFSGVSPIEGGFSPIPAGIYKLLIHEPSLEASANGNGRNITFNAVVGEGEYMGRNVRKMVWFIPNRPQGDAPAEALKKHESTMGFLMGKLQAVYGTIPENFKLNVRDLAGREFLAVVVIKTSPQYGDQNDIASYLPPGADVSKIHVPTEPIQDRRNGGAAAGASTALPATPARPGMFKI